MPFLASFLLPALAVHLYRLLLMRSSCLMVSFLGLVAGRVISVKPLFTCIMRHSIFLPNYIVGVQADFFPTLSTFFSYSLFLLLLSPNTSNCRDSASLDAM